ncbi:hypothetical protein STAS_28217 [Striga asiatica]|uniref:DUF7804 domain-containing protein n=1 Tax=Striga asiatica TaxID=4170 RepID=A0A5A7R0G7_STRAF|nr:hypothetical protein STAS_28217 [Striga asiatica]
MAAIGIHSSGANLSNPSFFPGNKSGRSFSSKTPFLSSPNSTKKSPRIPLASSSSTLSPLHDSEAKEGVFLEKIDSWLRGSVSEIVGNLKKAPLLVQVYSEKENGKVRIQTEKAHLDYWAVLKGEWINEESKSPDGLIFVEELGQDYDQEDLGQEFGEGVSRIWGIVIQGKGVKCSPACYLLKTNRVCAGMGLGFCTYYCLIRVNNLRDGAFEQFKDSWLLH